MYIWQKDCDTQFSELLKNIMYGHQMKVYDFDFTNLETDIKCTIEENREMLEYLGHLNHFDFFAEENYKKRNYHKFLNNRDYEDAYGNEVLKHPCGDDGTFSNTGYR